MVQSLDDLDALTGNAAHDGPDVLRADQLARFHLDVALAVTDEHLTGDLRVGLRPPLSPLGSAQIQFGTALIALSVPALCVAEVNDCPCYPVCHLVRVAWVHFLKHDFRFYGFLQSVRIEFSILNDKRSKKKHIILYFSCFFIAFFLHILFLLPNFAPEIRNKVITIKTSKL